MRVNRLVRIVRKLRAKGGCPWDRRQTHRSLKPNLLEETYEVIDAIDRGSASSLKEELGDLLMLVVFHAVIEEERGRFDLDDVIDHVCAKLVRRHPHVFSRGKRVDSAGALRQWERLKRAEKPGRGGLAGVPRVLPALLRALRVQSKASRLGFDPVSPRAAMTDLRRRMRDFRTAAGGRRPGRSAANRLGDAAFALVRSSRLAGIDPEGALQAANDRFIREFDRAERRKPSGRGKKR